MEFSVARFAPAVLLLLATGAATGQRPREAPHPGIIEFSRICLAPHTVEFALQEGEAARLGFTKGENTATVSDDDAKRFNIPEDKRTSVITYPLLPHGTATDPEAFSIWSSEEKTQNTVQRVDLGHGIFGPPGFAAPATFCSVLTLSDPAKAWAGFEAAFPSALFIAEVDGGFLGRMRSWALDLPWAPDHAAIVTISDYTPSMFGRAFARPPIALFSIEVMTDKDFDRMSDSLEPGARPI